MSGTPVPHSVRPAASFSAPITISTTTSSDQNGGPVFADYVNPATVTDASGYIWTAWAANVSGRWSIFFAFSSDGGTAFSTPVQLDSGLTTQDTSPSLAVYGSGAGASIAIVWETRAGYTLEPASSDGYYLDVSSNGGSSWTNTGTAANFNTYGYGTLEYVEAPVVAWTDTGNVLVAMWGSNTEFAEQEDYPTTTMEVLLGYTSGTTFCDAATCDGGFGFEGPTSTTAYYTALMAMGCSPSATDCAFAFSDTNSGGTTTYSRIWYDTDNFLGSGTGEPTSYVTLTTFTGSTAGDAAILLTQGGLVYSSGADGLLVEELQSTAVFSYDVDYYYSTTSWSSHTLGAYPTGASNTAGTFGAVVAADPANGAPYVSWIDSSDGIVASWASSTSGAFLSPITVATGGADSATSIGITTVASPSPFRVDVVYIDGESDPQVEYSNFLGLYATASASPTTTDLWHTIAFTSTPGAGAPAYSYAWNFGSGATCNPACPTTVQNPVVNYTAAGTYAVSVTVTDSIGESTTVSAGSVTINPLLTVTLSPATASVDQGTSLTFTATPAGGSGSYAATAYAWQVGGVAQASTTNSFSYTFSAQGTVYVSARVTDSLGFTSQWAYALVTVGAPLAVSGVWANPTPANVSQTIRFGALVTGGTLPFTYTWNLAGTAATGVNPSTSFTTAGKYPIFVNITDSATPTPTTVAAQGWALVDSVMSLSVLTAPTAPLVGQTVWFNTTVSGGLAPYTYQWDWGDGTNSGHGAGGVSMTHVYSTASTYSAVLWVNDSLGNSVSKTVSVVVVAALALSNVAANPSPTNTTTPVVFTATASGGQPGYTWTWSFGDGSTNSHYQSPTHLYNTSNTSPGYSVLVTVADAAGHKASVPLTVIVNPATVSSGGLTVTLSASAAVVNNPVTFTASVSGGTGALSYTWTFGDGSSPTSGSTSSTTHTYTAVGTYPASVSVKDSAGHSGSATTDVTVSNGFVSAIDAVRSTVDVNFGDTFVGTAAGGNAPYSIFTWTFSGDSTPITSTLGASTGYVTHAFPSPGVYWVNLTVQDSTGTQARAPSQTVTVLPAISVDLKANPDAADIGTTVDFTAVTTGGGAPYSAYSWNFGDGTTLSSQPTDEAGHTYAQQPSGGVAMVEVQLHDNVGGNGTGFLNLSVNPALTVRVQADQNNLSAPLYVNFTITPVGGTQPYGLITWTFGDGAITHTLGATAAGFRVMHRFNTTGTYTVTVVIADAVNGTGQGTFTVNVIAGPGPGGSSASLTSLWWLWLVIVIAAVAAVLLLVVARRRRPKSLEEGAMVAPMVMGGVAGVPVDMIAPEVPVGSSDQSPDELGGVMPDQAGATAALGAAALPSAAALPPMSAPTPAPSLAAPVCPRCASPLLGEGLPCPVCQHVATPAELAAMGIAATGGTPGSLTQCPQCGGPLTSDRSCLACQVRWEPHSAPASGGIGQPSPEMQTTPAPGSVAPASPARELTHCPQCGGELAPGRVCPTCQVVWEPSAMSPAGLTAEERAPAPGAPGAGEETYPIPPPPMAVEVPRAGSEPSPPLTTTTTAAPVPKVSISPPPPAPAQEAVEPPPSPPPVATEVVPSSATPNAVPAAAPPPVAPPPSPMPERTSPSRCFICNGALEEGFCANCNMSWTDESG